MGRYNSPQPDLVLEPSLESFQKITRGLQRDLDEAIYLTDLKTRIASLQSDSVTSVEQLFIKSSIATVVGRENILALSMEAMRIVPDFKLTVSQEGVGEMIKSAIKAAVEKVKQFFAWIRGLFAKFFKGDKEKAEQCKRAEGKADSVRRSAEEAFNDLKKNNAAFDAAVNGVKDPEDKTDRTGNEGDSYVQLLELAKEQVASIDRDGVKFILKRTALCPFRTAAEYSSAAFYIGGTLSSIPVSMGYSLLELITGKVPSVDTLKSDVRGMKNDKMKRFFDETTDSDGVTFFSLRREKHENLQIKPSELKTFLQGSVQILKSNVIALEQLQMNEQSIVSALEKFNGEDESSQEKLKGLKIWLKVNTSITRMLNDTSTVARNIGDDCLRLVDTFK